MHHESHQETYAAIWHNALQILQDSLSRPIYESWIQPAKLIYCDSERAILQVKSGFEQHILTESYLPVIAYAMKMVLGYEVRIEVVTMQDYSLPSADGGSVLFVQCANTSGNEQSSKRITNLNPEYTFDNFVMGSHNRYAYAACEGVASNIISDKKTRLYNPLFLHGNVGLGKTHLMHAIGNRVLQYKPDAKIIYLSSETFTNELINAIRNNTNEAFRNKYRHVDILLIDDIQFISNKEGTQEEFFHTFNALNDANKQIVITSDRPPKELPKLEERLRSRFSMGLIADIQPPDYETRIAIMRRKAEKENVMIPNEVYEYIAEHVTNNVRELDGALLNVLTFANMSNLPITLELAKLSLQNIISGEVLFVITGDVIMNAVADFYQLSVEELKSKRRTKEIVLPRQVAMYLCRELTDLSFPQIGELFGGRDHSTVLHGYDKIAQDLKTDVTLQMAVENIKSKLNHRA